MKRHGWIWLLASLPLLVILILPVVALVAQASSSSLAPALGSPEVLSAVVVSLKTTLVSTVILAAFGTPLAYGIASKPNRATRWIELAATLPAVLPPSVAGIALLLALGRHGILGAFLAAWGFSIPFTGTAVVLAQLFVAAPFFLRPAIAAFRSLDLTYFEAAAIDGSSDLSAFARLAVPLTKGPLVSGLMLAWARALGEFGATILFAGNRLGETRTLPLAIYLGFESDFDQSVAISVILLAVAGTVLILDARFKSDRSSH